MQVQAMRQVTTLVLGIALMLSAPETLASRQKSSLERFETTKLQVYTIPAARSDGSRFAYILDPDGYVHHVEVGEYVGNSEGRVSRITESEVVLVELKKDGASYREVQAVLKCDAWCRKR